MLVLPTALNGDIVTVRQDSAMIGNVEKVDPETGATLVKSSVNFEFKWPLVEMTSDKKKQETYVITFPDDAPGPVLYYFDEQLNEKYAWKNVEYSFFDLQYAPQQETLYGIKVTSSYGRVLSNFVADVANDAVIATELFELPYMWYVNASTINPVDTVYYGLINNFPGFDNSTLDQQLVVADFSGFHPPATAAVKHANASGTDPDAANVVPIRAAGSSTAMGMIVQFISYSSEDSVLYCGGMKYEHDDLSAGTPFVSVLNAHTGEIATPFLHEFPRGSWIGPMAVVAEHSGRKSAALSVYIKAAPMEDALDTVWELWECEVRHTEYADCQRQREYVGSGQYLTFAAVASLQ